MNTKKSTLKIALITITIVFTIIFVHDYVVGKKGGNYLYNCISFSDSSVEACRKSANVLFYNKVILFGRR